MACIQFLPALVASVGVSAASISAINVTVVASVVMTIATVVIAYFALQQHKLDANRVRVELYGRRLRVYKAVKAFIWEALATNVPDREAITRLHRATEHAAFLFPEDSHIREYIDSLCRQGEDLHSTARRILSDKQRTSEEQEELGRKDDVLYDRFRTESKAVEERFRPYLELCPRRWRPRDVAQ